MGLGKALGKTAIVGIACAFATGFMGALTAKHPDILTDLPIFIGAGIMAAATYWLRSPKDQAPKV